VNKSRVETFSDGIFAIAITLLILTIAQPSDYSHLARQLLNRWPSLAAYVVSFLVIGIMWVNHHTVFSLVERIDRGFFYRNLLLLMTVVFIPYPTEVFGEALRVGHGARTAAAFYSIAMTVNALAWAALWLHASTGRRLLKEDFPEAQRRASTVAFVSGTGVYVISIGVAFINPYLCLGFHAALGLYYGFDPISRKLGQTLSQ
jgi:uncharacterized membrane protein